MESLQQWIDQVPGWAFVVGAGVVIFVVQRYAPSRGGGGSDTGADTSHVPHHHHGGDSGGGDSGSDNN
jgi:hypothetical protein